ncbi:MAG: cysteine--tRNA ligase [Omnitrophica WOR_2 bacterium RBG_13_44_8]|nr:MAG: cysteine--tRNA ligase [Omnitrophica WOR_2 bacterium RBG_13_44_8]
MPIFVYNSLTRKKEEFIPLKPPKVNIYTCGVTVYDESHIGHARSLYIFDVIRRYLKYRRFKVRFVRNITDIDDKIINRARELKIDWKELVKKYIARYYQDLKILGIQKGDFEPRATANIREMIKHILGLMKKGYAYVTDSGVYFNVRKFKDYGKLSGQGIDQMQSGARIEPDENKTDPLDFALWKKSKPDEPSWNSPWGRGRPGWHIECSAMSQKFLKTETLDMHAGGRDLIFPHHENEIAQAEALTGKVFARYWIHHGLLTINGQKMAKSLGNFVTIKDFMEKYKNADLLKMFFLSAHYAHPMDYTDEKIEEAKKALERILILMDKAEKMAARRKPRLGSREFKEIEQIKAKFIEVMDDDFNTPEALAVIFELVNTANKNIEDLNFILCAKNTLKELLDILGVALKIEEKTSAVTDEEIQTMILEREEARRQKNYKLADKIRKKLESSGIILEDETGSTHWRRKL